MTIIRRRALGAQLVELVGQLLGDGGRVEAGKVEAGDVVEAHRIRHGGERLPVDRLQERLVGGHVVTVVGEPELLQDLQGVDAGPDPVVVAPGRAGAGGLLDRLHAAGDPFFSWGRGSWYCRCQLRPCAPASWPRRTISAVSTREQHWPPVTSPTPHA
jgi:hypothetical protein